MLYHNYPNTNIEVSRLGLGTWVFSGDVWGQVKTQECIDVIHAAIDHGITLIDTAPIYGHGKSEEIVGKALNKRRDKVFLATKCGLSVQGKNVLTDLSPTAIEQEIEASLRRLNVEYIDLYQCHWPDDKTPIEDTMEALLKIQEEGKVRHIGVSNYNKNQLSDALEKGVIISLQSQFSLLERSLEDEVIPFCKEQNVGVLAYGVLGGGILSGKYKEPPKVKGGDVRKFFYKYYEGETFEKVKDIIQVLENTGKSPNEAALNWVRQTEGVTSVLVGCRTVEQLQKNIQAVQWDLSEEQYQELNDLKLNYG